MNEIRKKRSKIELYIAAILIVLLFVTAILGPYIAPNDAYLVDMKHAYREPCWEYPFGTDHLGRCILSRILCGARSTLCSALFIVVVVFGIGTLIGTMAGVLGGIVDRVLMKITSVFQAFPEFILAVAVAGILGPGLQNGILSIIVVYWTHYARLSRSLVLQIYNENYMKAAKICGASTPQIIFRHVLPNIFPPMLTTAALDVSGSILHLAGLSFLGLGATKPSAEWGVMLNEAKANLQLYPWMVIFPGLALLVTVVLFNWFSDSIRDALDVKTNTEE